MGKGAGRRNRRPHQQATGGNNNEGITSIKMRNENKLKFQKQQAHKSCKGVGGKRGECEREDYQLEGNCNWALDVVLVV